MLGYCPLEHCCASPLRGLRQVKDSCSCAPNKIASVSQWMHVWSYFLNSSWNPCMHPVVLAALTNPLWVRWGLEDRSYRGNVAQFLPESCLVFQLSLFLCLHIVCPHFNWTPSLGALSPKTVTFWERDCTIPYTAPQFPNRNVCFSLVLNKTYLEASYLIFKQWSCDMWFKLPVQPEKRNICSCWNCLLWMVYADSLKTFPDCCNWIFITLP